MQDKDFGKVLRYMHAHNRMTAFLCHGPIASLAALDDAAGYREALVSGDAAKQAEKSRNWQYAGYRMTIYSNAEEYPVEKDVLKGNLPFYVADALQIAGGTSSDADGTEHAHDLVWLLRRNAWFFFWIIATAIISIAFKTDTSTFTAALLACAAMPLALVVADDSVSYVTNFFLENDPDDEDSPSTLGFALRSIGTGLVFAFICTLLVLAFVSLALPSAADAPSPSP